mmetsp:Transcript_14999/g.33867  ORF Transcript_14999/g.33867 Transcript_14999/m.33867 type:complete len:228 (-) Transcript_14999:477-1160(-)
MYRGDPIRAVIWKRASSSGGGCSGCGRPRWCPDPLIRRRTGLLLLLLLLALLPPPVLLLWLEFSPLAPEATGEANREGERDRLGDRSPLLSLADVDALSKLLVLRSDVAAGSLVVLLVLFFFEDGDNGDRSDSSLTSFGTIRAMSKSKIFRQSVVGGRFLGLLPLVLLWLLPSFGWWWWFPKKVTPRLSGLRSRCNIRCLCRYLTVSDSWRRRFTRSDSWVVGHRLE